jgi:hypothetical protein
VPLCDVDDDIRMDGSPYAEGECDYATEKEPHSSATSRFGSEREVADCCIVGYSPCARACSVLCSAQGDRERYEGKQEQSEG